MLSPLKPLLCRHDFYWSERHGSDRCRRCGKRQAAEAVDVLTGEPFASALSTGKDENHRAPLKLDELPMFEPAGGAFVDFDGRRQRPSPRSPALMRPSAKALKAQASDRRAMLMDMLERLAQGERPSGRRRSTQCSL